MYNIPLHFDSRYYLRKQGECNKYISYFCGIALHDKPLDILSCIVKCRSHNTKQTLKVI